MIAACALAVALWPPVDIGDVYRFGVAAERTQAAYMFAMQHRNYVSQIYPLYPQDIPLKAEWLAAAEWHYRCWDLLDNAVRLYAAPEARERRLSDLRRLRAMIGVDNYYAGRMPLPVPLQFFRERW